MKLWNLNTGEECSDYTEEQIANWIYRNNAECLARHEGYVSYWRTWLNPYESEIWRIEP